MRRASTCLALLGLAVLGLPAVASATPTITFKAVAIPIPGFPHTGNILGAGAALKTEFNIKGTEYDEGHPPPIIGVNVLFPTGSKLHPQGFATCSPTALKEIGEPAIGTAACPKSSLLTFPVSKPQPIGENAAHEVLPNESYGLGVVKIGNGPPPEEKARIQGFFAPGGGLEFFTKGVTPTLLEFISPSHTVTASSGGFGPGLDTKVPLIETLPGAADASTEKIIAYAGAAYKKGGKTTYYGTLPKKCPAGGFPVKAEITFATNGNEADPETVSSVYKAPCPRK
jgi:hypothetical protein